MFWIYVALLAILGVLLLLFVVAMKIIFTFNSDHAKMNLTLLWLYPFVKVVVTMEDTAPLLVVCLFNKQVYQRPLKSGKKGDPQEKKGRMELVRRVRPKDVHVCASYGFRDPSITGVACGAISMASQFIHIDSLEQIPDFVTENDYMYLNATAKLLPGKALINLIKAYVRRPSKRAAY